MFYVQKGPNPVKWSAAFREIVVELPEGIWFLREKKGLAPLLEYLDNSMYVMAIIFPLF